MSDSSPAQSNGSRIGLWGRRLAVAGVAVGVVGTTVVAGAATTGATTGVNENELLAGGVVVVASVSTAGVEIIPCRHI